MHLLQAIEYKHLLLNKISPMKRYQTAPQEPWLLAVCGVTECAPSVCLSASVSAQPGECSTSEFLAYTTPLFLGPKQCRWQSVSASLLLCWNHLLTSSSIVFSPHYVQMEGSSAHVSTAIGSKMADVCTVLALSVLRWCFLFTFVSWVFEILYMFGQEGFWMKSHSRSDS